MTILNQQGAASYQTRPFVTVQFYLIILQRRRTLVLLPDCMLDGRYVLAYVTMGALTTTIGEMTVYEIDSTSAIVCMLESMYDCSPRYSVVSIFKIPFFCRVNIKLQDKLV